MLLYDDVVAQVLRVCEPHPGFLDAVQTPVLVRDLAGRVRLVVQLTDAPELDLASLQQELERQVGGWFAGPILSTATGSDAHRRAARGILDSAEDWPAAWAQTWTDAVGTPNPRSARWRAYPRVLAKQSWLDQAPAAPLWPLTEAGRPPVVSFYSFKGGVGRSSALALTALQLARRGKKVLCVDLDLEAPGLDVLFGVEPVRGVLDFLLEHAATGDASADDLALPIDLAPIPALGTAGSLLLVPAGALWRSAAPAAFIEKLARLDYLDDPATDGQSPVARALRELITKLVDSHGPDYVFLDARSGLHDLGGLSLTELAHVDVLVSRPGRQGLNGLRLVLDGIRRRRPTGEQRLLIVHSFARLPVGGEANVGEEQRFRAACYDAFREVGLYADDPPALDDAQGSHHPVVIGTYDEILRAESVFAMSDAVREIDPYQELRRRVEALAAPEVPDGDGAD